MILYKLLEMNHLHQEHLKNYKTAKGKRNRNTNTKSISPLATYLNNKIDSKTD